MNRILSMFCAAAMVTMLTACNVVGEQYAYVPQAVGERPATINTWAKVYSDTQQTLITREPALLISAMLGKVGDTFVRAGISSFTSSDSNDTRYNLSPGRHVIGLVVSVPPALSGVDLLLDAQAGEVYTLGASADPTSNQYAVWIQDSEGKQVTKRQLGLKKTYSGITIP